WGPPLLPPRLPLAPGFPSGRLAGLRRLGRRGRLLAWSAGASLRRGRLRGTVRGSEGQAVDAERPAQGQPAVPAPLTLPAFQLSHAELVHPGARAQLLLRQPGLLPQLPEPPGKGGGLWLAHRPSRSRRARHRHGSPSGIHGQPCLTFTRLRKISPPTYHFN